MKSFHSFFSPDDSEFSDPIEDFDNLDSQVNGLIYIWLKRKYPDHTFDEIIDNIKGLHVTDEIIEFEFRDAHKHIRKKFSFGLEFLEELQQNTRKEIERIFDKKAPIENEIHPFSSKSLVIIQSWLPDITSDKIIDVANIYVKGKNDYYSLDDESGHDYLWIAFSGENNKPKTITIPYILKGEYIGRIDGNIFKIRRHREKTQEIIDLIIKDTQEIMDYLSMEEKKRKSGFKHRKK